jgi:hypothetical protein
VAVGLGVDVGVGVSVGVGVGLGVTLGVTLGVGVGVGVTVGVALGVTVGLGVGLGPPIISDSGLCHRPPPYVPVKRFASLITKQRILVLVRPGLTEFQLEPRSVDR